jgi:hypothetical protein
VASFVDAVLYEVRFWTVLLAPSTASRTGSLPAVTVNALSDISYRCYSSLVSIAVNPSRSNKVVQSG